MCSDGSDRDLLELALVHVGSVFSHWAQLGDRSKTERASARGPSISARALSGLLSELLAVGVSRHDAFAVTVLAVIYVDRLSGRCSLCSSTLRPMVTGAVYLSTKFLLDQLPCAYGARYARTAGLSPAALGNLEREALQLLGWSLVVSKTEWEAYADVLSFALPDALRTALIQPLIQKYIHL